MESQAQPSQPRPSKGTAFLSTCFNGFNALSGLGLISIPYALAQGGWLTLIIMFMVAILGYYTALLLHRCMEINPQIKTYADIGQIAFGAKERATVCSIISLSLFLIAVEILILEGDNMDKLFPNTNLYIAGYKLGGKPFFILVTALAVLPATWLRSLTLLAYVSASGVFASMVLVGSVFSVGASDGVGFDEKGELWKWRGLPMAVSMYFFCFCGHSVFPTIRNSMKDMSQFPKVLLVCFVLSTISYGTMAVLGYLMFGEDLKSQVSLNLPTLRLISKIAIYTTLVNPIAKYPLTVTPLATSIEDLFGIYNRRSISLLVRTSLVISTVALAIALPFFGYVMAFIGSFLSVSSAILFPCLCYLKIYKVYRSLGLEMLLVGSILMVGVLVAVIGTYTSVRNIIIHL
ncbi:hypothetical protein NMG60_11036268 [Bertholletia excelsa]